jgi:serine/threonine protein phosphatase PrpC
MSNDNFYNIPSALIEKALENNATDNITAVVLEY